MTNPGKYQGKDKETHKMCASAKARKEGTAVPHDVGREGGEVHGISVAEVTVNFVVVLEVDVGSTLLLTETYQRLEYGGPLKNSMMMAT